MTTEYKSFFTDEVKALIGVETEWSPYSESISGSEVRRFVHAIMDDNPVYHDEAYARGTKYGEVVCPPLYASFAFRRAHGTPDPLDRLKTDREWDAYGGGGAYRQALPRVEHGFKRMVNGGSEIDLYKRLRPGTRVRTKARYHDIRERIGSKGPMALSSPRRSSRTTTATSSREHGRPPSFANPTTHGLTVNEICNSALLR